MRSFTLFHCDKKQIFWTFSLHTIPFRLSEYLIRAIPFLFFNFLQFSISFHSIEESAFFFSRVFRSWRMEMDKTPWKVYKYFVFCFPFFFPAEFCAFYGNMWKWMKTEITRSVSVFTWIHCFPLLTCELFEFLRGSHICHRWANEQWTDDWAVSEWNRLFYARIT